MSHEGDPTTRSRALSRPIELSDIPGNRPLPFSLEASDAELKALATLFGAVAVAKFRFEGQLSWAGEGELALTARVGATVTQTCVVTLEPVRTRIDEEIARRYLREPAAVALEHQILPEDDDTIETLTDPIDIGAAAAEAIALALPSYPRAEGAVLAEAVFAEPGVTPLRDDDLKPFSSLAALKDKLTRDN